MARILVEGFETGDMSQWDRFDTSVNEPMQFVTNVVYSGMYSLYYFGLYYSHWVKTIDLRNGVIFGSLRHRWAAAWPYSTGWADSTFPISDIISFSGISKTSQITIGYNGQYGTLNVLRGNYLSGTILGSTAQWSYLFSVWHLIQFKIVIHPTNGIIQIWVDGNPIPEINLSGINTRNDSTDEIIEVDIGPHVRTNTFTAQWWDDLILDSEVLPSGSRVVSLPVSNNGVTNQWQPSSGLNYQCIDEVPYSDADYVYSYSIGDIDLFSNAGLSLSSTSAIQSIQTILRSWKSGLIPKTLRPVLRSGSTNFLNKTKFLGLAPATKTQIWERNPATGLSFVPADVGNLQFGVQHSLDVDITSYEQCISLQVQTKTIKMSNFNFINDPDLKALWQFEPDNFTKDTISTNTLVAFNEPVASVTDFKEGAGCVNLERVSNQYFKTTDSNLSSGFPFKGVAPTVQTATFCFWVKFESVDYNRGTIFWKGQSNTGLRLSAYNSTLLGGWNSETHTFTALSINRWYHMAVKLDGPNKIFNIRIWDDSTQTVDNYNWSPSGVYVPPTPAIDWYIGGYPTSGYYMDGMLDEFLVFSRLLTDEELDGLR
jgi:hypothetical protein